MFRVNGFRIIDFNGNLAGYVDVHNSCVKIYNTLSLTQLEEFAKLVRENFPQIG